MLLLAISSGENPLKPTYRIGDVIVYGTWDDVQDYEFAVVEHESGNECDVMFMSGMDYGGGIACAYTRVPREGLFLIIDRETDPYDTKRLVMVYCREFGQKVEME